MEDSSGRLLSYLRSKLATDLAYQTLLVRLTGGFDTVTASFRLRGGPADFDRDLILRILPSSAPLVRLRREVATHEALVEAGFPAPRVLLFEEDRAPLGDPFLIMERLAGDNMWASAVGPRGRMSSVLSLSRRLAEAHALLHKVDGARLKTAAARHGIDPKLLTIEGEIGRIRARIERARLAGLLPGADWLERNRPAPAEAEVICHGDFHPLNIMVDGDRLSGVIDWPQAIVAEPAFDVASTVVLLSFADAGVTGPARWMFDLVRRIPVRHYLGFYRRLRPFRDANMPYYECLRALSAMTFAGENPPGPRNPWHKPHTLAALYGRFAGISGVAVLV